MARVRATRLQRWRRALSSGWPKRRGRDSLADDALLFAAAARLKQGEKALAVERLLELVDRFPFGEMAADGLFRLFLLHRTDGKIDEALAFLQEIEGRFAGADDSFEFDRARYWHGRTLEELGQTGDALALYESVSREHPATYYGLIARERVESLDAERGAKLVKATAAAAEGDDPFPLRLGDLAGDPSFLSAVELTRLGLGGQVPMEVLAIDRSKLKTEQVRLLVLLSRFGQRGAGRSQPRPRLASRRSQRAHHSRRASHMGDRLPAGLPRARRDAGQGG